MLMRVFIGWLRGERGHCSMVAIPTMDQEDGKRPHRERENLVGEKTRIINRMKAALIRLGVRGFKPELRRAPQKLDTLRTPEGLPIPPNTLEEIRRDMARLAMVREQIDLIEQARLTRIEQAPETGPHAMVRLLASIIGVGVETADMLVQEVLSRQLRDRRAVARYAGLTGSPDESGCQTAREGAGEVGQCPRTPRPDPTRVALPAVPEGQRTGAMVSHQDRGAERGSQDHHDRGPRPQAADRDVATGHHRRNPGRRAHALGRCVIGRRR